MPDSTGHEPRISTADDALAIAQARADELDAIGAELAGILDALDALRAGMSGMGASGDP